MGADVRVRVLGPVTVVGAAPLQGRDRRVLGALVVEAGRVCPADRLAEALYGSEPPATWRKVMHGSVGRLRQVLGAQAIATVDGGYRLELGDDQIDVRRFERLVAEGERLAAVGEPERAALRLGEALELVVAEPFADLDGWEPGVAAAARVAELVRRAEEQLVAAWLAAGRYQEALRAAAEQVEREPLREQRWAALALAQYRAGRQGEALRTIRRARVVLADELGLDPGPELVGLERAILAQDAHLTGPAAVEGWWSGGCPYRGLAAYDVDDGDWFFGRDREIAECLGIFDAAGFVAIVGASGSGKSSLARAGVAPALRRHGEGLAVVHPGARPDEVLAGVERGSALVVDQLEELFVLCEDAAARARFAAGVCRWAVTAPVVVTLRADHLGEVTELPELAAQVQAGIYLLGAMGEAQLRAAIEGPAAKAGLRLEPGLVDLLVRDVAGEPGALPLLSHALSETYEQRDGPVLTAAGYRAVGGVHGAVARAADEVVDSLGPEGRKAARDLFLRLVIPTETSDPIRQRVPRTDLAVDPTTAAVLDALVASRLVIADQDTVEVAHEAVCRAWPRLQAWLDEDRDGLRLHRQLAQASREWDQAGREPSELYRGPRLVAALDWAQRDDADLNESERAFLDASADQRDAEQRQARRRIRRLRAGLMGVGVLLVVAMLAGVVAVRSGREAASQRDTARAAQQEAQVQRDGAQAAQQVAQEERDNARAAQREAQDQRESAELDALVSRSLALRSANRTLAALLAVEAHRRRPDAAAWSALLATFTATPNFQGYQYLPAERFVTGTLVPGTSNAVVALDGFDLVLVDLATGEIDQRFAPAPDGLLTYSGLRVSGDGRFVAQLIEVPADAAASTLVVYDVATGQVVFGPFTPPFFAADVALNTDGSLVALAGGPNGDLAVYRLADGQPVGTLLGVARPQGINLNRETAALEFGVDGHLYWGSILGPIRVVDVSAMQVVHTYEAPLLSSNNQIIVTSSGLLVAAGDEAAVAVDTITSSIRWTMARQPGSNACSSIAIAEGSGHFYCRNTLSTGAGQNIGRVGRLEERDLTTGLPTGISFDPQQGTAGDVGVTADERELVTFSHNAPLISRWRLDGSGAVVTRVGQQRGRISGGFDPTGTMMLVADQPRPSLWMQETGLSAQDRADDRYVWDPNVDQMIDPLDGIAMARWAGTPGRLVAVFEDRTIGMHDVATRSRVEGLTIEPLDSRLTTFGRSVDNSRFYLGYLDGRIQTFDSTSGEQIGPIIQAGGVFGSITASANGARVITTTFRNQEWSMTVHDATNGQRVGSPLPDLNAAEVGPDDTVVAATIAGDITEYDLDTLQALGSYPGARGLVNSITFSADGAVLTARSFDGTLSIYDVPSRTRIGDPIQGTGAVRADGRAVAINDDDNGIAIWDINPEHLATAACRLAGRNLTAAEWDTHLAALGQYRSTCPQFS